MSAKNPLEGTLTAHVQDHLASGEWTVIGMVGDGALKPLAPYLAKTFDVENTTGTVVVIVRRDV